MREYKDYYLALYGNLNDKWNLMNRYYKLINKLSHNDEDLRHELIVNTVFKFDYVAEKVRVYFKNININVFEKIKNY